MVWPVRVHKAPTRWAPMGHEYGLRTHMISIAVV